MSITQPSTNPALDLIPARLRSIIDGSTAPSVQQPPIRWVPTFVWLAFNFLLFQIDVLSAISVGMLSHSVHGLLAVSVLSGFMTLSAGFVPTLIAEGMYTNPYASDWQRKISVIVAGIGVLSTLLFGLLSAVANALIYTQVIDISTNQLGIGIEVLMAGMLVLVVVVHSLLLGIYFFIDPHIRETQGKQRNLANHRSNVDAITMAKELVAAAKSAERLLDGYTPQDLAAVQLAYQSVSGGRNITLLEQPSPSEPAPSGNTPHP